MYIGATGGSPMKITNSSAYAIGQIRRGSFHVRRVVWGRLLARAEKRSDEMIKRVTIALR
jgi:hypothetical protein